MHDRSSHPLLAQVPLTVSPFVQLPTATTLPYTYKTLPSTLPPSSTGNTGPEKTPYVMAESGHSAHPNEIIASCKALQAHIQKLQEDADGELKAWEESIAARELADKRRVAPGWLDSDARILEPERKSVLNTEGNVSSQNESLMDGDVSSGDATGLKHTPAVMPSGEGEDLDRAFGGLELRQK